MSTSLAVYSSFLNFPHNSGLSSLSGMTMKSGDMTTNSVSMVNALLLLTGILPSANSIITNVSVIQSWRWFFQTTPFEAIFLGFVIVQIIILEMLQILPINLNSLFQGNPSGRKKRHATNTLPMREKMAESMLNVLKRMDSEECFFRALCQVQHRYRYDPGSYDLPREIQLTLAALKTSSDRRKKIRRNNEQPRYSRDTTDTEEDNGSTVGSNGTQPGHALESLEEAIEIGLTPEPECGNSPYNVTACEKRYRLCPASTEDIFVYVDELKSNYYMLDLIK